MTGEEILKATPEQLNSWTTSIMGFISISDSQQAGVFITRNGKIERWSPASNLNDAFELVSKLKNFHFHLKTESNSRWIAFFECGNIIGHSYGSSATDAICRAALMTFI